MTEKAYPGGKYKPTFGSPARRAKYNSRQQTGAFRANGYAEQRAAAMKALAALYGKADKQ